MSLSCTVSEIQYDTA